jgi:hypothetical protein
MAKQSRDLAIPLGGNATLHPRETLVAVGALAAANADVTLNADGGSSFAISLSGVFNMTVTPEGTLDGVNWFPIPVRPYNQASVVYVAGITGAVQGVWVGRVGPWRSIRARCSAFISGPANVTLAVSMGQLDDTLLDKIANSIVTTIGAAGVATTLILNAPGAGLRQYIDKIEITRFATAALVAAAAPVTVSTANLPGALAWTFPADALAIGATVTREIDFPEPLASSAQNTAVTIACPATPSVQWRVTAYYKIAP